MKKENKPTQVNRRRKFLKASVIVGGGMVAGVGLRLNIQPKNEELGEKIQLLTANGELVEVYPSQINKVRKQKLKALQERGREGLAGHHWVMVIDLAKCQNARKCVEACQKAHELKSYQHHINILQMQENERTAPYFMPKPCFHCDNPPCTKVCPVDATFKRKDGIVLIDNERCIGCRFCTIACPYSARIFQWFEPDYTKEQKERIYDIELNIPHKMGTISKCLFSADMIRQGKLPYCVSACPNGVYWFGDRLEDAVVNGSNGQITKFSELISENAGYTYFDDLGTKPQVYYLPPKNRTLKFKPVNPVLEDSTDEG